MTKEKLEKLQEMALKMNRLESNIKGTTDSALRIHYGEDYKYCIKVEKDSVLHRAIVGVLENELKLITEAFEKA